MEKYYNEDREIGVIYSPGYGAGWSTWADDNLSDFLTMDKRLVEMLLNGSSDGEVKDYLKREIGESLYCGGWEDCEVVFVPEGTRFVITEYDGHESITILEPTYGNIA